MLAPANENRASLESGFVGRFVRLASLPQPIGGVGGARGGQPAESAVYRDLWRRR